MEIQPALRPHSETLSAEQSARLDVLLRNESDVAYKRRVRRMLSWLDLQPGQNVLDCGVGMGFYSKAMLDLVPGLNVWGIDLDERVLRFAYGHLAERGVGLLQGDIHALPFADASFDRVVMSEVLEHLTDDAGGLREVVRVMRPGAVIAMTVPHRRYSWWYDPINRAAEALTGRPIRTGPFAGIWANHERLYTREQVLDVVQGAGLVVEQVEELTHFCFPGTQTWVYTVGKGLIDHGLLPEAIARSTHRFRGEDNRGSALNPFNWMLALFNRIDRLNEDPKRMARVHTYVNIAIRARRA
ncbi:MAG: methyltransferase domain-containing protein [Chloroflexi bacterium]|nr:methyltransferase domain-containing protein [Chloroflexota bacterium]